MESGLEAIHATFWQGICFFACLEILSEAEFKIKL